MARTTDRQDPGWFRRPPVVPPLGVVGWPLRGPVGRGYELRRRQFDLVNFLVRQGAEAKPRSVRRLGII